MGITKARVLAAVIILWLVAGVVRRLAGGSSPAAEAPEACVIDSVLGSNVWLIHGGHDARRLARASAEFDGIGWAYEVVGEDDAALERTARAYPYFAGAAGRTSSGGRKDRADYAHAARRAEI